MASAPPSESLVVDLPPDVDDGEFGEATTKRKLADSDWCSHGPTGKKRRKKSNLAWQRYGAMPQVTGNIFAEEKIC